MQGISGLLDGSLLHVFLSMLDTTSSTKVYVGVSISAGWVGKRGGAGFRDSMCGVRVEIPCLDRWILVSGHRTTPLCGVLSVFKRCVCANSVLCVGVVVELYISRPETK